MERHGFVHDMLDVKVLILYIMARVAYPVDLQKIYELSYQDDGLSYFDVAEAVPQMIESGHLERVDGERYVITEKGREAGSVTEDSVAYPVMQRARAAGARPHRPEMAAAVFPHARLDHFSGPELRVHHPKFLRAGGLTGFPACVFPVSAVKYVRASSHSCIFGLRRIVRCCPR